MEPEIVINRATGEWTFNHKLKATTSTVERLRINYTGLRGPARHALVADVDQHKTVTILSTGYTGDKQELLTLAQMIAEFTASPHLYAQQV